uniref:Cellular repressor of E1A-stimulated genes 2 n=1 Tax=Nothobranchius furzeri TaxID=105023 RepID=A0A8C6PER4_NOTFU
LSYSFSLSLSLHFLITIFNYFSLKTYFLIVLKKSFLYLNFCEAPCLPFGNIFSVIDGPLENSTGVIYFYMTNPYASLTFSEILFFCVLRQMVYDPEDPRCARLTLTGKMVEVAPDECFWFLFESRHPAMAEWPVGHKWFFMKMDLIQDYFKTVPF